ncbi:hypothetical protein GCM10027578_26200 [Spirosoma luteolum]
MVIGKHPNSTRIKVSVGRKPPPQLAFNPVVLQKRDKRNKIKFVRHRLSRNETAVYPLLSSNQT